MRELVAALLLVAGTFFLLAGTIGILRMPDVYTRMHVAAKSDSLGAGLWLLGLAVVTSDPTTVVKLIFLVVFIWITSPTAAHCMARAAYRSGVRALPGTLRLSDGGVASSAGPDAVPGKERSGPCT
ncbi:MAG: monovalent cation/H(+) antiporter subunit G [Bacillota bacterium]|nr:monovalent cation/H(+) antiporter subunit G [Bacillota bacterium]